MKLLKEKTGEVLPDIGMGKESLNETSKAQTKSKMEWIHIKIFLLSKGTQSSE